MATCDVLVAGEINPDLILTGDVRPAFGQIEQLAESATMTVGSSSAIFACGAARLGLRVSFVGVCGEDFFGRFMLGAMQERGVNIAGVFKDPNLRTGISVILNCGTDRAILTYPGCIGAARRANYRDDVARRPSPPRFQLLPAVCPPT